VASTVVYQHPKNQLKPAISFPSRKEWNESEYGMIVSGVTEFMNIFEDICLFWSVSVTGCPLLPGENRPVWEDLLVYRTFQFDKDTAAYEFFA
jgi:hypothetical protein